VNALQGTGLALALGCLCAIARAQSAVDPIDACAGIADANARLACFDRMAQQRRSTASRPTQPAPVPGSAPAATRAAPASGQQPVDDTVGLDGRQLSLARRKEGIRPAAVPSIVASLAALEERRGHQYSFRLDNGQVWESTDTQPALFLRPHQTVTIRPGLLGAFFLKTEEGNSIRVHRVQ